MEQATMVDVTTQKAKSKAKTVDVLGEKDTPQADALSSPTLEEWIVEGGEVAYHIAHNVYSCEAHRMMRTPIYTNAHKRARAHAHTRTRTNSHTRMHFIKHAYTG
jgi:hypothetical protein